jgi:outer membrane protein OmpA-like peptidoglycan-associated protein
MNEHRTATGAVAGGLIGGGAGALIDDDNPWRGALIGTAAGSLIGAGVGHVLQKQKEAFDRIEGLEAQQQKVVLQQPQVSGSTEPPKQVQSEALVVRIPAEVLFAQGSSALTSAGTMKIHDMANILREYPDSDVYVHGYTSSEGDDKMNFDLSQRRAEVVKGALVTDGIAPARLYAMGMGSSNPIADNSTEFGRTQNRRVELYVVPRQ